MSEYLLYFGVICLTLGVCALVSELNPDHEVASWFEF